MSAASLGTFVWILLIIIIAIILIFVLFKLLDRLFIAPLAYAQEGDIVVNKTTTVDNDTTITITCTENLKGLIESCG